MAILESVKELASKLGAETNGRDITDQLNKINKHLDEAALSGRDIAEAVKTYSKNASGGGGGGEENIFDVIISGNNGQIVSDKTFAETVEAILAGKVLRVYVDFGAPENSFYTSALYAVPTVLQPTVEINSIAVFINYDTTTHMWGCWEWTSDGFTQRGVKYDE